MATQAVSASGCWRWVPLLTPAVKKDSCEVDHSLLLHRTLGIGLAAIATVGAVILLTSMYPSLSFLHVVPLFFALVFPLDIWIAESAANVKAVNEYLTKNHPSKEATFRIQYHSGAAQLLVAKGGDLNKSNEVGEYLLDHPFNLDTFKHLVDHGINIKGCNRDGTLFLQRMVENKDPAFLEYVLTKNKVRPTDFTPTQQVNFWVHLGNVKAGRLLAQHGFDVNIRSEKGFTPLLKLAKHSAERYRFILGLGPATLARTLLECGADRSVTVEVKGTQKTALELAANPAVQEVLRSWRS